MVGLRLWRSRGFLWEIWIYVITHHLFRELWQNGADIDIDPFGDHDKTDLHPDDTGENTGENAGENIPLP